MTTKQKDLVQPVKLTLTPGVSVNLQVPEPGIAHVTTSREVHYVWKHAQLNIDMLVHFLPTGITSVVRAHASYRHGNPNNDPLGQVEADQVFLEVLEAVHTWRLTNAEAAGTVDVQIVTEDDLVAADAAVRRQELIHRAVADRLADAERYEQAEKAKLVELRARRTRLKKDAKVEYLTSTDRSEHSWFVFTHCWGETSMAFETESYDEALIVMNMVVGYDIMVYDEDRGPAYVFTPGPGTRQQHLFRPESLDERFGPGPGGSPRTTYYDAAHVRMLLGNH